MDAAEWWPSVLDRLAALADGPNALLIDLAGAALLLLLVAIWLLVLARRRLRDIEAALDASTRGALVVTQLRVGLLRGDVRPPPEPFRAFSAELILHGPLGPIPSLGRQTLVLSGQLPRRPAVELVWQRGRTPDRALGRGPDTRLWVARRLDVAPGEFAVRGADAAALEHAFVDLQTRFGHCTRRVRIVAEAQPDLEISFEATALGAEEIPALITTVRALARAALVGTR